MKLSVVVPCYNECETIDEFHASLSAELIKERIDYELIMVDDGSTDDTYIKLNDIHEEDKNVKIIRFSRNFGKESAMLAGLEASTGDYVGIMDADMQHTPEVLLLMLNKLLENKEYDIVASYKDSRGDERTLKRTLTALFYKVNNFISNVKLLPGASDFRVFKRCVRDAIVSLPEKQRFLKGIFSWIGFNTMYVPYTPEKRKYGTSKWSIFKLIKYSVSGIISFSNKPLRLIIKLGVLALMLGLINFILLGSLGHKTIILLLGIILLCIGIIALYVSRIYTNTLNRPAYIIKEKIGFKKTTK